MVGVQGEKGCEAADEGDAPADAKRVVNVAVEAQAGVDLCFCCFCGGLVGGWGRLLVGWLVGMKSIKTSPGMAFVVVIVMCERERASKNKSTTTHFHPIR